MQPTNPTSRPPPSCQKARFLRNDSLRALFLSSARRYACSWPSRSLTHEIDVRIIPLTADALADAPLEPAHIAGQADFLLDAWRSRASRDGGLLCRSAAPDELLPDAPRLVVAQFWGWHADLGYQRTQHLAQHASVAVRQRVCAHYGALRELMYPSAAAAAPARKAVALLMCVPVRNRPSTARH